MQQDQQQWIGTLVSVALLAVVLALRMRKLKRARPLRLERLWMLPAFYAAVVALLFGVHPPQGKVWLYALAALALGTLLGWYRGKLMHIHVDPQTHALTQQGSAAAMFFILALVALRYAGRSMMQTTMGNSPLVMIAASDVLLAFGLGFVAAQRLEMGLRARALLNDARNGSAAR